MFLDCYLCFRNQHMISVLLEFVNCQNNLESYDNLTEVTSWYSPSFKVTDRSTLTGKNETVKYSSTLITIKEAKNSYASKELYSHC